VIRVIDTSNFNGFEYPEQLKGAWFYYVFFENHPNKNIDGICCIYFNDRYPSGSVCVGDHILNDYPDAYSSWTKPDEDGNVKSARVLVSPILRGKGIAKAGGAYGMTMLRDIFGKTVIHDSGNELSYKAYAGAAKIANLPMFKNTKIEDGFHMSKEFFDQPIYPYVFFGRRASE
jgi:hypothetical protein